MKKLLLLLCLLMTGIASALALTVTHSANHMTGFTLGNPISSSTMYSLNGTDFYARDVYDAAKSYTFTFVGDHSGCNVVDGSSTIPEGSTVTGNRLTFSNTSGAVKTFTVRVTPRITTGTTINSNGHNYLSPSDWNLDPIDYTITLAPWKNGNTLSWDWGTSKTVSVNRGSTYSVDKRVGQGHLSGNNTASVAMSVSTVTGLSGAPDATGYTNGTYDVTLKPGAVYRLVASQEMTPDVTYGPASVTTEVSVYYNNRAWKSGAAAPTTISMEVGDTYSWNSEFGSNPTLTVTSGSGNCTTSGNTLTATNEGTVKVKVTTGDGSYYKKTETTVTINITKGKDPCDLAVSGSHTLTPTYSQAIAGVNLSSQITGHADAAPYLSDAGPGATLGPWTLTDLSSIKLGERPTADYSKSGESGCRVIANLFCDETATHKAHSGGSPVTMIYIYPAKDNSDLAATAATKTLTVTELASFDPASYFAGTLATWVKNNHGADGKVTAVIKQGGSVVDKASITSPGTYTVELSQGEVYTVNAGSASYTLEVTSAEVPCNLALTTDTDTKTYADVKAGVNLASYIASTSHAPSSVTFSTTNPNYEVVDGKLKILSSAENLNSPVVVKFACPAVPGSYEAGEATLTLTVNKVPNTLTATTPLNITVDQAIAGYDVRTNSGLTSTAGSDGAYAYSLTSGSDAERWVTTDGVLHGKANETYVVRVRQWETAFYEEATIDITVNVGDKHDCDLNVATRTYNVHYSDVKPSGSGFAIDGTLTRHSSAVDPVVLSVPESSIVEVVGGKIRLKSTATALGSETLTATCPEDDTHKAGTNSISFTIHKDENVISATDQTISVTEAVAGYDFVSGCGVSNSGTENTNAITYTSDYGTISGNTITGLASGDVATITASQAATNFVEGATKTFKITVGAKAANNLEVVNATIKKKVSELAGADLDNNYSGGNGETVTTSYSSGSKPTTFGKYTVTYTQPASATVNGKSVNYELIVIKDNDSSDPTQPHAKTGADTTTEPGTPTDPIVDPGQNGKTPTVVVKKMPGGTTVTPWPYTGGGGGGSVTPPAGTDPGEYQVTITFPEDPDHFIPETTVGPITIFVKSADATLTIANQTIEKGQTADLSSSAYTSNNLSTPVFYRENSGSWEAITSAETASLAIGTYSMKVSLPNYVSGSTAIPAIEREFTLTVTKKTADIDIPVDPSDPSIKKTDTNEWTVTKKLSEIPSGFDVSSVVTGTDKSHLTYILHSGTGTLAGTLYETTEVGEAHITATWAGDAETNAFNGEIIIKVVSDENVKVNVTPEPVDPSLYPKVKETAAGKYSVTIQLAQASNFDLCSVLSGDQKNDVAFTTSAAGCSISGARFFSTSSVGTYVTNGHLAASGVYPAFDAEVTVIVVKNSDDSSAPHETGTEDPDGKKPGEEIMEPFVTPGGNTQPPVIKVTPIDPETGDPTGGTIVIPCPGMYPTDKPVVPTSGPGSDPGKYKVEIEIPDDPTTHTPGGKFGPYTYTIGNPDATFSAPDQYIIEGETGNFTKTAYTSANKKTPTFYVKNGSTWTPITSAASLTESTTPYEIQVVLPVDDVNIVEAHEFRPSATSGDFKLYVGHENPADKKKDEVNLVPAQIPYNTLDNVGPSTPTTPGITYEKKPKGGSDTEYTPFSGPSYTDPTPGDFTIRITIPADPTGPTPKKVIVYDVHVGPEFHYGGDTTQPELESIDGETLDVEMDRTFIAGWNTICLPFSLGDTEIYTVFGPGAQVWEFTRATTDMIMHFTRQEDMVEMSAGVPYMIYLPTAVVNPTFHDVTIDTSVGSTVTKTDDNGDAYKFTGAVTATELGTGNGLRMLSGTSIKKPSSAGTLKASRCYYQFPASAGAKSGMMMFMNFNETTGIEADATVSESENQVIYTIGGQRVKSMSAPGVYIVNGKKVVKK